MAGYLYKVLSQRLIQDYLDPLDLFSLCIASKKYIVFMPKIKNTCGAKFIIKDDKEYLLSSTSKDYIRNFDKDIKGYKVVVKDGKFRMCASCDKSTYIKVTDMLSVYFLTSMNITNQVMRSIINNRIYPFTAKDGIYTIRRNEEIIKYVECGDNVFLVNKYGLLIRDPITNAYIKFIDGGIEPYMIKMHHNYITIHFSSVNAKPKNIYINLGKVGHISKRKDIDPNYKLCIYYDICQAPISLHVIRHPVVVVDLPSLKYRSCKDRLNHKIKVSYKGLDWVELYKPYTDYVKSVIYFSMKYVYHKCCEDDKWVKIASVI